MMLLEACGLVQGTQGDSLVQKEQFNEKGHAFLKEGNLTIHLGGVPGMNFSFTIIALTPLGQEVLCLVGSRNAREAARAFALDIRTPEIHEARLDVQSTSSVDGIINLTEVLWLDETLEAQTIEGTAN